MSGVYLLKTPCVLFIQTSSFPLEGIEWLHGRNSVTPERVTQAERSNHEGWRISSVKVSFTPITLAQIDFLCTNDHVPSRFAAVNSGANGFTSALTLSDITDNPLSLSFSLSLFFPTAFLLRCNLLGFVPR